MIVDLLPQINERQTAFRRKREIPPTRICLPLHNMTIVYVPDLINENNDKAEDQRRDKWHQNSDQAGKKTPISRNDDREDL